MNHELAMCFCSMSVGTMTPTSPSSLTRSLPQSGRAFAGVWGGGVADFKWGDDRGIFLGLKSSILRFLFGKANLQSIFFGDLI